jgi:hypothetical protein
VENHFAAIDVITETPAAKRQPLLTLPLRVLFELLDVVAA